jgi:hypothetical protein
LTYYSKCDIVLTLFPYTHIYMSGPNNTHPDYNERGEYMGGREGASLFPDQPQAGAKQKVAKETEDLAKRLNDAADTSATVRNTDDDYDANFDDSIQLGKY